MTTTVALLLLAGSALVQSQPHFVSYIATIGSQWTTAEYNEGFLKYIGVPGYGGSRGYNVLNFAFWVSTSNNGGAAINGAATAWQTIEKYITSSSLKHTLTGSSTANADQLRAAIHALYNAGGVKIFISAFGGADHPMAGGKAAIATADALAAYAKKYEFDGVDVDWEEAYYGKFDAGQGGATWLCALTNRLRSQLDSNQLITHAPQAPYFMGARKYADGGYLTVHKNCGNSIDWYNVQFYNQGSTSYNTYAGLFTKSIGWSTDSGVYQIMAGGDGSVSGVSSIPSSKIVVGKHTVGDGSTFVGGAALKGIFTSALAAGRWNAGFMSWQFYKEASAASGNALIDQVLSARGWGASVPTPPPTPTPPPVSTPSTNCGSGRTTLKIVNEGGGYLWWYAGKPSGVPAGWYVTSFEVKMANGGWFLCSEYSTWYQCGVNSQMSYPTSVKVTAAYGNTNTRKTVTVSGTISSASGASVDSRTNFGCDGAFTSGDDEEDGVSWTVWFAVVLVVLVVIALVVGGYCMWRKRKKGKGYTSDTLELRENAGDTTKGGSEMIEVDVDGQQAEDQTPIKTTAQ